MKQFIPFEDNWEALENLRPEDLVPYRVGFVGKRNAASPVLPSTLGTAPAVAPIRFVDGFDRPST